MFRFPAASMVLMTAVVARAEVPMRWDATGHVVVPTRVNQSAPVNFILDTGADETGVYSWFAKRLNLPQAGTGEISGATGSAQSVLLRVSRLSVDGHDIVHFDADTLPDRPDGARLGGIVGADLMAGRLTVMDFGCGTAALLRLDSWKREVGRQAYLVKAGSVPGGKQLTLPVTVNGASGIALLDSGARTTLINQPFASAAGLDPASSAFRDGDPARGASQTAIESRFGTIGTVAFAGVVREGATARVVDLPFLAEAGLTHSPVMVLGLDLLRGTRLSLDYSGRRFWVAQSKCPAPVAPHQPSI